MAPTYLVGAAQQHKRDREAKCLCGLEVDDEFVTGSLEHGNISGFITLENPVNLLGGVAVHLGQIERIGH